jgi:hypothetical protein
MGCLIVILATSLIPTGYISTASQQQSEPDPGYDTMLLSVPAQCLCSIKGYKQANATLVDYGFDGSSLPGHTGGLEPFNVALVLLAMLYMISSYLSRVIGMFIKPSDCCFTLNTDSTWILLEEIDFEIYATFGGLRRALLESILGKFWPYY